MNRERIVCTACAHEMVRMKARGYKMDTYTGAYCPNCKLIVNDEGVPLVPVTGIIDLDPELKKIEPPSAAYVAVIEVFRNPDKYLNTPNIVVDINKYLKIQTREPGAHEPAQLDREKFRSDLKKSFEKEVEIDLTDPVEPAKEE